MYIKIVFYGKRRINGNSNIFNMQKIYSSKKKNPLKENQNPSRYHNSIITNLKFQHNLAKIYQSSFKNPRIKNRPIIYIT